MSQTNRKRKILCRRLPRAHLAGFLLACALALACAFGMQLALSQPGHAEGGMDVTMRIESGKWGLTRHFGNGGHETGSSKYDVKLLNGAYGYCNKDSMYTHTADGWSITSIDPVKTGELGQDTVTRLALAHYYIWDLGLFKKPNGQFATSDGEKYGAFQGAAWKIAHDAGHFDTRGGPTITYFTIGNENITGWNTDEGDAKMSAGYRELYNWVEENLADYTGYMEYFKWESKYHEAQDTGGFYRVELRFGSFELLKSSSNEKVSKGNGNYSLAGAKYGLFESQSDAKQAQESKARYLLTTDDNGKALLETVKPGDYWLGEIAPSKGYERSEEIPKITVEAGKAAKANVKETPSTGQLDLVKKSANEQITNDNSCYTLKGAEYGLFASEEDARTHDATKATYTLVTDGSGKGSTGKTVAIGTYWLAETKPSPGYALSELVDKVAIKAGQVSKAEVVEKPFGDPTDIAAYKLDDATGSNAQGAATLEGAEFTMNFYAGDYPDAASLPSQPTRTWVLRTDKAGCARLQDSYKVSGSEFYQHSDGRVILPLGTVSIQETRAPEGYLLGKPPIMIQRITPNGIEGDTVDSFNPASATQADAVKRGDLAFNKVDERSMSALSGVAFRITSKTTGESHVVVSDDNGYVSTSSGYNAHSINTNKNDSSDMGDGTYAGKVDMSAGVWFAGREADGANVDDSRGALPYDTYVVEELAGTGNEGYDPVSFEIKLSRDSYEINRGTIDNTKVSISTELVDHNGSHYVPAIGTITLTDTITYDGLIPGTSYQAEGELVDKETGETISFDGNPVTSVREFTAQTPHGTVEVPFSLSVDELAGKSVVAFQRILDGNGRVVAAHEDPDDPAQTVDIPAITTTLESSSGEKSTPSSDLLKLVDRIDYRGLEPGVEHLARGVLHQRGEDGSDQEEVLDADGKPIVSEALFVPESDTGSALVEFEFDSSIIDSAEIVAFEELYKQGSLYAVHADIDDDAQMARITPPPTIEKYVDADVHVGLGSWEQVFSYDILAFITSDAQTVSISDTLADNIDFAGDASGILVSDLGTDNNHKTAGGFTRSMNSNGTLVYGTLEISDNTESTWVDEDGNESKLLGPASIETRWFTKHEIDEAFAKAGDAVTVSFTEDTAPSDAPIPSDDTDKASVAAPGTDISGQAEARIEGKTLTVHLDGLDKKGLRGHWVRVSFDAKLSEDAEWVKVGNNGTVLSPFSHEGIPNHAEYVIGTSDQPAKYETPSNTVTVTPPGEPALEKYVNKDVHQDLESLSQTFTYDILAYVTTDANTVTICDELIEGMSFVSAPTDVVLSDLGKGREEANNHRVGGSFSEGENTEDASVCLEGANITEHAEIGVDGQKLAVKIVDVDSKGLRDHWVRVSFEAKADAVNVVQDVEDNGPVLSSKGHVGIPNQARYFIDTATKEGRHESSSNTVTVLPPAKPVIEKYVGKDVHQDLLNAEDSFDFDIMAYVTPDAESICIHDELVENLRFDCDESRIHVTDMGEENNHKVSGNFSQDQGSDTATVLSEGQDISKMATIELEGQHLAVRIANARALRGHWVRVAFSAKLISDGNYQNVEENTPLETDYTHLGVANQAFYEIAAAEARSEPVYSNRVTVAPPVVPSLEKYVGKDVHLDLANPEEVFTYDIMAYVTRDATAVTIRDELGENLAFACGAGDVKVAALPENNHKTNGSFSSSGKGQDASVCAEGVDIGMQSKVSLEGRILEVRVENLDTQGPRSSWIRVTFQAKLDHDAGYVEVLDNGSVLSDRSHKGVPNTCAYTIDRADKPNAYNGRSNMVTVSPSTVEQPQKTASYIPSSQETVLNPSAAPVGQYAPSKAGGFFDKAGNLLAPWLPLLILVPIAGIASGIYLARRKATRPTLWRGPWK